MSFFETPDFTLGDFDKAQTPDPKMSSADIARIVSERMKEIREEVSAGNKHVNLAFQEIKREDGKYVTQKEVLDIMHRYLHTGGGGGGLSGDSGSDVSIVDNEDGTYTLTIDGDETIINTVTPGDGTGTDDQTADEVSYDNATSGLTATDVKAALDELAASSGGGGGLTNQLVSGDFYLPLETLGNQTVDGDGVVADNTGSNIKISTFTVEYDMTVDALWVKNGDISGGFTSVQFSVHEFLGCGKPGEALVNGTIDLTGGLNDPVTTAFTPLSLTAGVYFMVFYNPNAEDENLYSFEETTRSTSRYLSSDIEDITNSSEIQSLLYDQTDLQAAGGPAAWTPGDDLTGAALTLTNASGLSSDYIIFGLRQD